MTARGSHPYDPARGEPPSRPGSGESPGIDPGGPLAQGFAPGFRRPEIVFAPAHPQVRDGRKDVVFEIRELADGRRMLPVFTTTERLVTALGPEQPWAALPLRAAQALMSAAGVEQIVLDPAAEADAWRWQESDLEALRRGLA
ncbi:MAG TPA: SAV_915 family protein [Streptosporangiaceae bacterium]|nr:SAV_915 family protein [Streptosporangiaceae bacterium]